MHILSPETNNCPSWISGKERMTVENISWSISTKECCRPRRGLNPRLLVSSQTAHPNEPPTPKPASQKKIKNKKQTGYSMQNIKISFENAFFIASEDIVTFQPKSIDIFLISQRKHIYGTHFFFFTKTYCQIIFLLSAWKHVGTH